MRSKWPLNRCKKGGGCGSGEAPDGNFRRLETALKERLSSFYKERRVWLRETKTARGPDLSRSGATDGHDMCTVSSHTD